MSILLADDSPGMRSLYRTTLERLGHAGSSLLEATGRREALAALEREELRLIVFDWDLPGLDGMELLRELKARSLAGRVQVLFCVGRSQRGLLGAASRLGSFESLDRPFTEQDFEKKVRGLAEAAKSASSKSLRPVTPAAAPRLDSGSAFLHQLPAELKEELLKVAVAGLYEPGEVVLRAGRVCEFLHFVTRGEVELVEGATGAIGRTAGPGEPFGDLSFMTVQPSSQTVRARTHVQTASLSRLRLAEFLKRRPEFERWLSALMEAHKPAMTARATTLAQSDFKGTFDMFSFADVLQMLMSGRKTGVLGLRNGDGSGGIYLEGGEALHAWTDDAKGDEAFYALSSWTAARFAFNSVHRQEPRTLTQPTITLLMEAMRRREENPAPGSPEAEDGFPR